MALVIFYLFSEFLRHWKEPAGLLKWSGKFLPNRSRGPFLEAPVNYPTRYALLFFILDSSIKGLKIVQ